MLLNFQQNLKLLLIIFQIQRIFKGLYVFEIGSLASPGLYDTKKGTSDSSLTYAVDGEGRIFWDIGIRVPSYKESSHPQEQQRKIALLILLGRRNPK